IAFACGLLFAGPLTDRFGRRPFMIGGLVVFALGSLISALSPSLWWVVAGRVVQAIGAAGTFTVSRAIVGDLFEDVQLARRIATLTMVTVIGT
ncbi:MFS transporter, partial [Staphylococcus aureus]|uniref:MFS transporter n=1 Tax=Staphylococcus aureus TaxID=1280 RepID=UPI00148FA729